MLYFPFPGRHLPIPCSSSSVRFGRSGDERVFRAGKQGEGILLLGGDWYRRPNRLQLPGCLGVPG